MPLTKAERVTTSAIHINTIAIHKLMEQVQRLYDIPPCSNISAYLAMLQVSGLVSKSQADAIRAQFKH